MITSTTKALLVVTSFFNTVGDFCRSKLSQVWERKPKNRPYKTVTKDKTKTGQRAGQKRDRRMNKFFLNALSSSNGKSGTDNVLPEVVKACMGDTAIKIPGV